MNNYLLINHMQTDSFGQTSCKNGQFWAMFSEGKYQKSGQGDETWTEKVQIKLRLDISSAHSLC